MNPKNGGYTWTITFLRDGPSNSGAKGQWGLDCEQRDSFYNLCNSPGNVPALTFVDGGLGGDCRSYNFNLTTTAGNYKYYNCTKVTIMTGDSAATKQPPGSKAVQRIFFDNADYNSTFGTQTFNLTYVDYTTGIEYQIPCASSPLNVSMSANAFQEVLYSKVPALNPMVSPSRGVAVTTSSDTVHARNGQVFTLHFFDEGPKRQIKVAACSTGWSASTTDVVVGAYQGTTAKIAGVQNGIVQRGRWNTWYVYHVH